MREHTIKVFHYDELTPEAQAKAREWYRKCSEGDIDFAETVYEDAKQIAPLMGIEFKTRKVPLHGGKSRDEVCIFWSGFNSQGDGACFEGRWDACSVKPNAVKEYAPQDETLHRIAAKFEEIAKSYPEASFTVRHTGHYYHKHSTSFDVSFGDDAEEKADTDSAFGLKLSDTEDALTENARAFMQWIYKQLEQANDDNNSDESIAETIRLNKDEFTEDGEHFNY